MDIQNYKNHFLIAMPSLQGEFFAKSVVYIYEHTEESGAIGFVVNLPLSATLENVMHHLTIPITLKAIADLPVFSGGPVGPDQGFVLHDRMSLSETDDDTDVVVSTTREILVDIAEGNGPDHFMVVLGYSGWDPGELEVEIQENDWIVAPFDKSVLFNIPIQQRWIEAARLVGVDVNRLSSQIGRA